MEFELTRHCEITLPPQDFSRYPGNKLAAGIPPLCVVYSSFARYYQSLKVVSIVVLFPAKINSCSYEETIFSLCDTTFRVTDSVFAKICVTFDACLFAKKVSF